jgi:hypothetical protein
MEILLRIALHRWSRLVITALAALRFDILCPSVVRVETDPAPARHGCLKAHHRRGRPHGVLPGSSTTHWPSPGKGKRVRDSCSGTADKTVCEEGTINTLLVRFHRWSRTAATDSTQPTAVP